MCSRSAAHGALSGSLFTELDLRIVIVLFFLALQEIVILFHKAVVDLSEILTLGSSYLRNLRLGHSLLILAYVSVFLILPHVSFNHLVCQILLQNLLMVFEPILICGLLIKLRLIKVFLSFKSVGLFTLFNSVYIVRPIL